MARRRPQKSPREVKKFTETFIATGGVKCRSLFFECPHGGSQGGNVIQTCVQKMIGPAMLERFHFFRDPDMIIGLRLGLCFIGILAL